MKIIELLNKIANGEEVPKHIKLISGIELYYCEDTLNYYNELASNELFNSWIAYKLNDEVEIIEDTPKISKLYINNELQYDLLEDKKIEDKKIKKIDYIGYGEDGDLQYEIIDKINEIIDKLNEGKDE